MSRKEVHPYWCILPWILCRNCLLEHLTENRVFSVTDDLEYHPTKENKKCSQLEWSSQQTQRGGLIGL